MKVSIQIPTYNQEKYISKAIKSALMQSYENLEIVILDDGSSDHTFEIATSFASDKIKVFRNNENLGRAGTYRKLLYELTTGDWIANLDGDDYYTNKDFITKGIEKLLTDKSLVFYQAAIIGVSATHEYKFQHRLIKNDMEGALEGKFYFKNFHRNEYFGHLATLYNAKKARQIGFYTHSNLNADAESILKLALHGKVYLDNTIIGDWLIHENNESKKSVLKNEETILSFERLQTYSVPFIGFKDAEKWFSETYNCNFRSYMGELAKLDFFSFLRLAISRGYVNFDLLKLILKKLIGRI